MVTKVMSEQNHLEKLLYGDTEVKTILQQTGRTGEAAESRSRGSKPDPNNWIRTRPR